MPTRKRTPNHKVFKDKYGRVDIGETLFNNRTLFVNQPIMDSTAEEFIKEIITLDMINKKPIQVYINSPGGAVSSGFAMIDIIKQVKSKVITIVQGQVASMGTLLSIAGDERKCFPHSTFMFHDMFGGGMDYSQKIKDRVGFLEKYWEQIADHIKTYTNIKAEKDFEKMRSGELWLFSKDAKEKGLVDEIIQP